MGRSRMKSIQSLLRSISSSDSGGASVSGSRHSRPERMSSRSPIVMARLRASTCATVRSPNDASTGSSRRIVPRSTAMPTSVPTIALVTELTAWRMPGRNGAYVASATILPWRTTSRLSISLAAPKSTRSASAAGETPCASGVDASQPAVGHGVASDAAASAPAAPSATSAQSSASATRRACRRRGTAQSAKSAAGRTQAGRAQPPDDAGREVVDREHEQDPEPEQPPVRRQDLRQHRDVRNGAGGELHQVLQVALREDEQHAADDGTVDRAHAADHDDQQHVEHDLE